MAGGDKDEEALLRRIQQRGDAKDKSSAIAIAKERNLLTQDGKNLRLTSKGRRAASEARRVLEGKKG